MAVCASQFVVHLLLQVMSGILSLVSSPHPCPFCIVCWRSCPYWVYINRIEDTSIGMKMGVHLRKGPPFTGKGSRRLAIACL